jgi:formyl-CoA transferase
LLNSHLVQRSTAEWMEAFDRVGLPAGPVLEIPDVLAHPQTLARGMIVETDHPLEGKTKGVGLPIRFSGLTERRSLPAPLLGEHTFEVLSEIGFSASEISALVDQRAVFAAA